MISRLKVAGPAAFVLWVLFSAPAFATPVAFDFTLTNGTDFTGSFSIDGASFTSTGSETFTPDAAVTGALLAFDVTVLGTTFTMSDDTGFPSFPRIGFVDGNVTEVNYNGLVGTRLLDILLNPSENYWTLTESGSSIAQGVVGSVSRSTVPEPGTLALLGGGLIGLVLVRRKRAA